jgi:L-ascorbate metabolism protein UlaG (beta-lactamase superfamily)
VKVTNTFTQMTGRTAVFLPFLAVLAACGTAQSENGENQADPASAQTGNQATSILNAGVMTAYETADDAGLKFLFDPLYDDHFGSLAQLTPDLIERIIAGAPPYDGVDAVFVSHAHGDHFSVSQLTAMLEAQEGLTLVIPTQGLEQLREGPDWDATFETRVWGISLENGEASEPFTVAGASVDAFRSPHSGWPDRHASVHNITFRVSVPGKAGAVSRVMHLGDADPDPVHYEALQTLLQAQRTGLAIVPFWFTGREDVAQIIDQTLNSESMVAVHVPVNVPDRLKEGEWTYFSKAGEVLEIPATE